MGECIPRKGVDLRRAGLWEEEFLDFSVTGGDFKVIVEHRPVKMSVMTWVASFIVYANLPLVALPILQRLED